MGTTLCAGPSAPCASPARSPSQRKLASLEAVERRRLNREAAARYRQKRGAEAVERRRALADAREQLVVARLLRRFVPHDQRSRPLFRSYAYWQARKCGWDVLQPHHRYTGRRDKAGERILMEPEVCPTWLWWSALHWKQRYMIAGGGRFTLREDRDDVIGITQPNFYLPGEQRVA